MTTFDAAFDQALAKTAFDLPGARTEPPSATVSLKETFHSVDHFDYDPTRLVVSATIVGEQYRTLKANLTRIMETEGLASFVFSSSVKGEGKTTLVVNTAREFARERGAKIAVVDCDFKRPGLAAACGVAPLAGFEEVLSGDAQIEDCGIYSERDNLVVFPVKKKPGDISELLSSGAVTRVVSRLEALFDVIFIDTSPVLSTSEPLILGAKTGGVVLVVRADSTQRESVLYAQGQLEQAGCRLVGVVLNARPSYVPRFWLLRKYEYFPDAYRYRAK